MKKNSRFRVESKIDPTLLNVEPEGAVFKMGLGTEVEVRDCYKREPVTVRLERLDDGHLVVTVWPGDGDVTVLVDGKDVLAQGGEEGGGGSPG